MNSLNFSNRDAFSYLDVPLPENIFAHSSVVVSENILKQQHDIIHAIESVVALPAYQHYVLNNAPDIARFCPKAKSVFFGYDFHIDENDALKLIEINTNAGGALLNSLMFNMKTESVFVEMFKQEWQLSQIQKPLNTIAIVDESPMNQYLYAEFLLFKQLFEQHGIHAIICAPEELHYHSQKIWYENTQIDLIYNRLTDFSFVNQPILANAYLEKNVVITPHPRAHALYADKRNLIILSSEEILKSFGVAEKTRDILINGIAQTMLVEKENAEMLWQERKKLFFKPAKGYGSKAAYRGDKLTKRVFSEILKNDYVVQTFVLPKTTDIQIDNSIESFKYDIRAYVYDGDIQLTCARLYQGQTTNFRTYGGGFAPLICENYSSL